MSVACPCTPPSGWWIMMRACGSAKRLPLAPAASSSAPMRRRLAHADGGDGRLDVLHRVVDRHARGHRAARRVDVEVDVLVRVLRLQEQHLRDDEVGDLVLDVGRQEDDPLLEQPREDVERPLAAGRLLDHHRNQTHRTSPGCHAASVTARPLTVHDSARCSMRKSSVRRSPERVPQPLQVAVLLEQRAGRPGPAAGWPRRSARPRRRRRRRVGASPSFSAMASSRSARRTAFSAPGRSSSSSFRSPTARVSGSMPWRRMLLARCARSGGRPGAAPAPPAPRRCARPARPRATASSSARRFSVLPPAPRAPCGPRPRSASSVSNCAHGLGEARRRAAAAPSP